MESLAQYSDLITVKLSIAVIAHVVIQADKHTLTIGRTSNATLLLRLCDISHFKTSYSAAYSLTTL